MMPFTRHIVRSKFLTTMTVYINILLFLTLVILLRKKAWLISRRKTMGHAALNQLHTSHRSVNAHVASMVIAHHIPFSHVG
jgi:hypothetical protein